MFYTLFFIFLYRFYTVFIGFIGFIGVLLLFFYVGFLVPFTRKII